MRGEISVDVVTSRYADLAARETMDGVRVYRVPILGRREQQTATFVSMFSYLVPALAAPRTCVGTVATISSTRISFCPRGRWASCWRRFTGT